MRVLKTVSPNSDTRKYRPIPNTGIVRTLVLAEVKLSALVQISIVYTETKQSRHLPVELDRRPELEKEKRNGYVRQRDSCGQERQNVVEICHPRI